jgi:hypothetical protein
VAYPSVQYLHWTIKIQHDHATNNNSSTGGTNILKQQLYIPRLCQCKFKIDKMYKTLIQCTVEQMMSPRPNIGHRIC